ncbi:MAG: metal ABC transporter permease [Candidatus Omnitrophica bacterium]|nr:metal ABC transporter permease [Candidatus Omnitrophota bacterium]
MINFFQDIIQYSFLQQAIIAGLLACVACGITGSLVVVKKMTYVSGGMAHAIFGGVGIAYYFGMHPLIGALMFAILASVLLGLLKLKLAQKEDTLISAFWSLGMAVGIIFMYLKPGYNVDLMSFLFGNILMVSKQDVLILVILDLVICLITFFYYRQLMFVCFDEEYTSIRGFSKKYLYILLLCVISMTVVVLMQIVGLILVIALLTLPASIAGMFSRNLGAMMRWAVLFGMIFIILGLFFAYHFNIPSGAAIIVLTTAGYILAIILKKVFRISH